MRKTLTILIVCISILSGYAQKKEKQKLTREERKEIRLKEEQEKMKLVDSLISHKKFVFRAERLSNNNGGFAGAVKSMDYFVVDSSTITCQFISAKKLNTKGEVGEFATINKLGSSAVGDRIINGQIDEFNMVIGKRSGWYNIRTFITSNNGRLDVRLNVSPLGKADGSILFWNNYKLNCEGYIYPIDSRDFMEN